MIKLYLDEDVPAAIALSLRLRGYDEGERGSGLAFDVYYYPFIVLVRKCIFSCPFVSLRLMIVYSVKTSFFCKFFTSPSSFD